MNHKTIPNYIGQLRIYSYLDLFVFATALTSDWAAIFGIGSLWFSFLLYLESRHNDQPRLSVNKYLWIGPFTIALTLLPVWICFLFGIFSYMYTQKKKEKIWGITAPFWRGLQNGLLAIGFNPPLAVLAVTLTFARNLIADFRDAHSDHQRGINTIPVLLGVNKNQVWAFFAHILLVITSTIIWFSFSFLDSYLILPIILLQILSYPLTPRLSNPKYLNMYR